jgi:S1-C subfamily serine protease
LPISKEFIDTTLASIAKYGKIVRPLLGIQYVDITQALQKEKNLPVTAGALINDVLS